MNFGGSIGLNFTICGLKPLWVFTNVMTDANLINTNRMNWLIDIGISAGLGWRFTLVKDRLYLTPRISYGYMLHVSYGSYFNEQRIYLISYNTYRKRYHYFSDQYMQYGAELAVDVSSGGSAGKCELFLSPEFVHFIERHRQGLEVGYKLGVRFNVEKRERTVAMIVPEKKELPPTILAGRVVDAETGRVLQQVVPSISEGKADKANQAIGETFSFVVDPLKDNTLRAEHEGYEPLTYEVKHNAVTPNKKTTVTLAMKPSKIWGIFGHIFEKETNEPLKNVEVAVIEIGKNKKSELSTNDKGDFRMELQPSTDYEVTLKKRKYFTVNGAFTTKGRTPGWFDLNKFMRTEFQKVKVGATMDFANIYYDSGSWQIRPDVIPELNKIVRFLNDNPTIVVELGAHTDSMGDAGQNLILSQKRAQSAVEYLVKKGIKDSRITAKGYGETKIKNRCVDGVACSADEHKINRRTEIQVTKITEE